MRQFPTKNGVQNQRRLNQSAVLNSKHQRPPMRPSPNATQKNLLLARTTKNSTEQSRYSVTRRSMNNASSMIRQSTDFLQK